MNPVSELVGARAVHESIELPCSLERAWDYLTRPDLLATWLGRGSIDPRVGAAVDLLLPGGPKGAPAVRVRGHVLKVDPPRLLEVSWEEDQAPASVVRFELRPQGGMTVVEVTHERPTPRWATDRAFGWVALLPLLLRRVDPSASTVTAAAPEGGAAGTLTPPRWRGRGRPALAIGIALVLVVATVGVLLLLPHASPHQATPTGVPSSIQVWADPTSLLNDPANGDLYVLSQGAPYPTALDVVSTTTDTVTASIPVGSGGTFDMALDPYNGDLYVAENSNENISVISTSTNSVVAMIPPGNNPGPVVVDTESHQVFTTNGHGGVVVPINVTTNTAEDWVWLNDTGAEVASMTVDPSNGVLYVADGRNVALMSTSADALLKEIPLNRTGAVASVYDPSANELFVAGSGGTAVVNPVSERVVAQVNWTVGPNGPWGMIADPSEHEVFVTNSGANNVTVISDETHQVVAVLPVGAFPTSLAINANGSEVYVGNYNGNNVSVLQAGPDPKVLGQYRCGSMPTYELADPSNGQLYIANDGGNTLTVVAPGQAPVPVGSIGSSTTLIAAAPFSPASGFRRVPPPALVP